MQVVQFLQKRHKVLSILLIHKKAAAIQAAAHHVVPPILYIRAKRPAHPAKSVQRACPVNLIGNYSGIRLLFQLRNTLKARKGLVYEPFVFDFG